LPNIVRTQVDVVLPQGAAVLNADDAQVLALADYSDGEVLLYSLHADAPALARHRARKGRAVFMRGQTVVLATGADETPLLQLHAPDFSALCTTPPADAHPHVLAAVATAWALGLPAGLIRAGLLRFVEIQPAPAVH
ncbi:MAG: cyanophycin synthetase, partial [Pseudomonadota bacterium]|nr:cyanophycin synthetase [Pseudomonadota bacterium]